MLWVFGRYKCNSTSAVIVFRRQDLTSKHDQDRRQDRRQILTSKDGLDAERVKYGRRPIP